MQAIQTSIIPATDHHPTMVQARTDGLKIVVPYDHEFGAKENHRLAAEVIVNQSTMLQSTILHGGQLPNGTWAWVPVEK